jgi:hypothetical protein
VGNLYPRLKGQVQILPATWVAAWVIAVARDVKEEGGRKKRLGQLRPVPPVTDWRDRQVVAYPVHSPNHWTLGVLINLAWDKRDEEVVPIKWVGLHFDSFPCNTEALLTAQTIGRHITGINSRSDLAFVNVPVPGQRKHSNDCALWPAHYLKMFLQDIQFYTEYCQASG